MSAKFIFKEFEFNQRKQIDDICNIKKCFATKLSGYRPLNRRFDKIELILAQKIILLKLA
jgi:hypothetical protein